MNEARTRLGAKGIATRSNYATRVPGRTTRSKDATNGAGTNGFPVTSVLAPTSKALVTRSDALVSMNGIPSPNFRNMIHSNRNGTRDSHRNQYGKHSPLQHCDKISRAGDPRSHPAV